MIVTATSEDHDASGSNQMNSAGSAYIFERDSNNIWIQTQKITASDRATADNFGRSVSISDNYIIVGANREDHDAAGSNAITDAGAAYIFERDSSGNWVESQKITASDRSASDQFGFSVSISGNYAIAGAYQQDANPIPAQDGKGAAYIFERNATTGNWTQVDKITASDRDFNDQFGFSVSIDKEGYAVVGARNEDEDATSSNMITEAGAAYIFERNSAGNWPQTQKIVSSDRAPFDHFGISVAISGGYLIVGAYEEDEDTLGSNTAVLAGSAYIFRRNSNAGTSIWTQIQKIVASDREDRDLFGRAVAIADNHAVSGASREDADPLGFNGKGAAYIFEMPPIVVTGLKTLHSNSDLEAVVYPNPAQDFFIIEATDWAGASYSLTDMTGRIVRANSLQTLVTQTNITGLPAGLYLLQIRNQEGLYRAKLVIK